MCLMITYYVQSMAFSCLTKVGKRPYFFVVGFMSQGKVSLSHKSLKVSQGGWYMLVTPLRKLKQTGGRF